jgi:hypothetical protein
MVAVACAVVVSYVFDALLPDDARLWGTLGLCAIGAGCFLLGGVALVTARTRVSP